MSKYISIEADINDADFVTEVKQISEEDIEILKEIINKLLPYRSTQRWDKGIPYSTEEMERDESSRDHYVNEDILTNEECDLLEKYLPSGDENYRGIHTISNIQIFEELQKIL